jgi:3-methylcrotonyl-CoA carboxylase alpha subunit
VEEGMPVPVQYDPMLAKLIASGGTRDRAIERAIRALRDFPILGVRTNVGFLIRLLAHDAFRAGEVDTGFVERHATELTAPPAVPAAVAAAAEFAAATGATTAARVSASGDAASHCDPWSELAGWGRER